MDPNVTWQRALGTLDRLLKEHDSIRPRPMTEQQRKELTLDLAYDLVTLGEWFEKGGFAPNASKTVLPIREVLIG